MNRKGHLPTLMIFVVALILVLAAWFSFLTKSKDVDENAKEISALLNKFKLSEEYIESVFYDSVEQAIEKSYYENFEGDFKGNFSEIINERDLRLQIGGNFFGKIRNNEYALIKEGNNYELTVDGIVLISDDERSRLKKEINLKARFNEFSLLDN